MAQIKIIFIDCDGTLTSGHYYVSSEGSTIKGYNTRDFFALKKIKKLGYRVIVLTGAKDGSIDVKCNQSEIECLSNCQDKATTIEKIIKGVHDWSEVAILGDAENDIESMQLAGFSACPSDAIKEVIGICDYVSEYKGGDAVVYDIIRYIFELEGIDWISNE